MIHAGIIHFVNPPPGQPGHYGWHAALRGSPDTWLDVTRGPQQQPGLANGDSVAQLLDLKVEGYGQVVHEGGAQVLNRSLHSMFAITEGLPFGEPVAPSPEQRRVWSSYGYMFEIDGGSAYSPAFPEGERRYIGVLLSGDRRGWIEVELIGLSLTAFSWAHQTEPGMPILAGQVPSPGAGSGILLAVAAAGAQRRRRS